LLRDILGGAVDYDEKKRQWYYKKGNTLYSINTTAEGIKKIDVRICDYISYFCIFQVHYFAHL
ncbi:MAG: hypothetical protein SPL23_01885, partial [Lachnospiraceae bacterium]|nr:hypothetical protein [Lachnospiraceae bacterium]